MYNFHHIIFLARFLLFSFSSSLALTSRDHSRGLAEDAFGIRWKSPTLRGATENIHS